MSIIELRSIRLVAFGQVTLVVGHWVAAVTAVIAVVGACSVWSLLWVWVELSTAVMSVVADSGSARTMLFKFIFPGEIV